MKPYTHADFTRTLLTESPELREEVENLNGLLHLEMGAFARFTQRAKGRGDWDTCARSVRLADMLWRRPDPELYNALNVSYLEHLDFEGPRSPKAWNLLTPALQKGWRNMQAYLEDLFRRGKALGL